MPSLFLVRALAAALVVVLPTAVFADDANPVPVFTSTPYPIADIGHTYGYTAVATDPDGDALLYLLREGPEHASLGAASGEFTWSPAPEAIGIHAITLRAVDPHDGYAEQRYELRVLEDFCPIYPIALPRTTVEPLQQGDHVDGLERGTGTGNFSWLTWDGDLDAPRLATSLLPPGDSHAYAGPTDPTDRLLEIGDWTQGATGSMNSSGLRTNLDALLDRDIILPVWEDRRGQGSLVDYLVWNFAVVRLTGYQLTGNGWLSFEFRGYANCHNDPPQALDQALETLEDTLLAITLTGGDRDGNPITFELLTSPEFGTLDGDLPELSYTPATNYHGSDAFTFRVHDGEFWSTTGTASIQVLPVNDAPLILTESLYGSAAVGLPYSAAIVASDPDGDTALRFELVSPPAGASIDAVTGELRWTPTTGQDGTASITVRVADDGGLSATREFSLAVTANGAPVFTTTPIATTTEDQAYAYDADATDPDGDILDYALLSAPTGMQLDPESGLLQWSPTASDVGDHPIRLQVRDGRGGSDVQDFSLRVASSNRAPLITSTPPARVNEGATYQYAVEGEDPDQDALSYHLTRAPPGTTLSSTGALAWTASDPRYRSGVRSLNLMCREPARQSAYDPEVRWHWQASDTHPTYDNVMTTPLVMQATDDTGDGHIDASDHPDVLIVAYAGHDTLASGIVRILDGREGSEVVASDPALPLEPFSQLAAADIDGDGRIEILAILKGGGLVAFEHDLAVKWTNRDAVLDLGASFGGASIADLDGDSVPEILIGNAVVAADGQVKWKGSVPYRGFNYAHGAGLSYAADLHASPGLEVLSGPSLYSADGQLLWRYDMFGDGFTAVADLDGDGQPEIVSMAVNGYFRILRPDGSVTGGGRVPAGGGPPVLGNLDSDPQREIAIADLVGSHAFEVDGTKRWHSPFTQTNAYLEGLSLFDFEGDGRAEVLSGTETALRVLDGVTGQVLWSLPNTSRTLLEYPVVADVDRDGSADVVLVSNHGSDASKRGVRLVSSASRTWVPARAMWNQHAYHVDNINDDGSVPRQPRKSWLGHNSFRESAFADRHALGLADLALFDLRLDPATAAIHVTVTNRGLAPTAVATSLNLYAGDPQQGGGDLGTLAVPVLASGESSTLTLDNVAVQAIDADLYARVDEEGLISECLDDNNVAVSAYFAVRASDPAGLSAQQAFTVTVDNGDEAPVIITGSLPDAPATETTEDYRYSVQAVDPDLGDALRFELFDAPAGLILDPVSGELRWTPVLDQIGTYPIRVRVSDLSGLSTERAFSLSVTGNRRPLVTSLPPETANENVAYAYQVSAQDDDGDVLRFELTSAPEGMSIDPESGLIEWLPAPGQHGEYTVTVRVTDGRGGEGIQTFLLFVSTDGNHPPTITSSPELTAPLQVVYEYSLVATDPDGDALRHRVRSGPAAMAVNEAGQVTWLPDAPLGSVHPVVLEVSDGRGGFTRQAFDVTVVASVRHAPVIVSSPVTATPENQLFEYTVEATDRNLGEVARYSFAHWPGIGTIDGETGLMQLTPPDYSVGQSRSDDVACRVADRSVADFEDLRSWTPVLTAGGHGGGPARWVVDPNDPTRVTLYENQAPSMLVSPIWTDEGAFEFSMRTPGGDDDYMGFVWGYRDPQHYYVLRWGQGCGCVEVLSVDTSMPTYEGQGAGVTVLHRIEQLGWRENVDHTALIEITRGGAHIDLRQSGTMIASFFVNDSRFDGGFVGLYNYSQDVTHYRARRMPVVPAPDLTVSGMEWDGERVAARIRNRGSAASVPVPVRLHEAHHQGGYPMGLLLDTTVPALAPGEEAAISYPWPTFGRMFLAFLVEIDPTDALSECHDSNNKRTTPMFVVRATDPTGLYDDQSFAVQVDDVNEAPVFGSTAAAGVAVGGTYSYQPYAADPDVADRVRYELVSGPGGMQMLRSGLVLWTPKASDLGRSFEARIRAVDLAGAAAEQAVQFDVTRDPVITSTPVTFVQVLVAAPTIDYRYQVEAQDPDGDTLTYRLLSGPPGYSMSMDAVTGVLTWQAPFQWGTFRVAVEIEVSDSRGGRATQAFTVIFSDYPLPANGAPVFTRTPPLEAERLQPYQYQPTVDDDGTFLTYRLVRNPSGMVIDASTGRIDWRPALVQWGDHEVEIEVRDAYELAARQTYRIEVEPDAGNRAPQITSSPTLATDVGSDYRYALVAVDPDDDALRISIEFAPDGMIMDGERVLHWTPVEAQRGDHLVHLQVEDGRGGIARQEFLVRVDEEVANRAPQIVSTAPTVAHVGCEYRYAVVAEDADGDALAYALSEAPGGMTIDAQGVISYTPASAQVGTHAVQVRVTDARGASTAQDYTLTVLATGENQPPTITSTPYHYAKVGRTYGYAATATDPDGDTLSWSLIDPPAGAEVDAQTGLLTFEPALAGAVEFVLRVTDGDFYADQGWTLTVADASVVLGGRLHLLPDPVAPGGAMTIAVEVDGEAGPVVLSSTLGGAPVTLLPDTPKDVTAPTVPGPHTFDVTIDDGFDTVTLSQPFTVTDPDDASLPAVQIHSPREGATEDLLIVTSPQDVVVSVDDDTLQGWTLRLFERGAPGSEAILLASGSAAVDNSVVATLDPTLLENGQYGLMLEAHDHAGNLAEDVVALSIEGGMKLGHFSISFEDLNLPVAGLPVSVTRTYDTRQRHRDLDFGHGWSLAYRSLRVQESRRPGFAWMLRTYPSGPLGLVPKYCVESALGNVVSLTRPDGKVEKFRAVAFPACNEVVAFFDVELRFEPMPGTTGALAALNDNFGRLINGSLAYAGSPDVPLDPSEYRYVDAEGVEYTLDQGFGLRQVHERPGGNTITIGHDGIQHSNGNSVTFVRDAADRITHVLALDGSERSYEYDAEGNLAAVVDAGGSRTGFTYLGGHYLQDIIDARGVRVARNEYDDGRLVAVIDADGNRVEYTRDIAGRVEQVKDRRGNTTTYVYNDRGDVLAETNALNQTTQRSYDADGNELIRIDPLGRTQRWTYDALGNVLTETNAADETTTNTYGKFNQLLTQTDATGQVILRSVYRNETLGTGVEIYPGPLVSLTDANGAETLFGYNNATGELAAITDAAGATSRFETDAHGYGIADIDALGHRTDYSNDAMGRVLSETRTRTRADRSTETLLTSYTLDEKGRVTATVHPDGSTTTTVYDGNDKPIRECDALDRCTVTTYDARGNATRTDYPDGTFETRAFDANGNTVAETDRAGRTTRTVYDAANRPIETILPDETPADDSDNPRTRTVYDAAGRLSQSIDANGHATTYGYDATGRQVSVTDALGNTRSTEYDAAGRRSATVDAEGHRTEYVYDAAGRLLETIARPAPGEGPASTRVEYDATGRKAAEFDAMGRTTRYGYDALGRLVTVVLPDPATGANPPLVGGMSPEAGTLVTTYAYDEVGNKIAQTDAEGRTTRWEYDAMGREIARLLPEGQRETRAYNAAGELVAHTDFNGQTTRYSYDAVGRLQTIDTPTDADTHFGYTPAGERNQVVDARGTSTSAFDQRARLVRATDADGASIEYQYDAAGNLLARISPSQSLVYSYDAGHRLQSVIRSIDGEAPITTTYEYDRDGNRSAMQSGDGVRTEYRYDSRHRLRELVKRTAAGALMVAMTYSVDASGMRTAVEESDPAGISRNVAWHYDATRRLVEETIDHRDAWNDRQTAWSYDRVGNRLAQTRNIAGVVDTTSYAYDPNDRLLTEASTGGDTPGTTTYGYDANGNTVQRGGPQGTVDYTYDDANRLTTATGPDGSTAYVYNADGLRVRKTHTPIGGVPTTTWYVQDSNYAYAQTIETYRSENGGPKQLEATFTFADDLVSQTRYGADGTPSTSFVHADGFGSTRRLTDVTGAITDSVDYDAFGNEIGRSGTTDIEHLFRSEPLDPTLGFYYFRARYYDQTNGRFTRRDQWQGDKSRPFTLNSMIFADADPVNGWDPTGYFTMTELSTAQLGAVINLAAIATIGSIALETERSLQLELAKMQVKAAAGVNARRAIRGIPIIFYGSDVYQVTDHIDYAQVVLSSSPVLTRRTGRQPSGWVRDAVECRGKTFRGSGLECDEYPFASTNEGGRQNYRVGRVSLRPLNQVQNSRAGGKLLAFYNVCGVSPFDQRRGAFGVVAAADGISTSYSCADGVMRE